jgi:hypothetical protein
MTVLEPDQDFDLLVAAWRYLVGNFDEITNLAREYPAPISIDAALRAGFYGRVKESLLREDEGQATEFGEAPMVMN